MAVKGKLVRSFLFFWLFLFLFKFGAGLQYTLLSPLGARVLPLWIVGLIIFAASIFQLVLDIPAGRLMDRFGYRKMLLVGALAALVGMFALFFGVTILSFVVSIFLVAVGWLLFSPGINAYSLSHATRKNSVLFMTLRDIFTSLGIVAACLLLPFIVHASGRTLSFVLSGIIGLSLVAIYLAPRDRRRIAAKTAPHERTNHQRRYLLGRMPEVIKRMNPASSLLLMLNCAAGVFYGVVWFVVPLIIATSIYNGTLLSLGLALFDLSVVVVGAFLCNMVQKTEKKLMIFVGLLVFSVSGLLLGFNFGLLFLVFAFLSTTGDETASLPLWAWLHKLDAKHNRDGLVSGMLNLASDIGWAVGPLAAGIFYYLFGPTLTIAIGAIPIVAVLAVYFLAVRTRIINVSVFDGPAKPHKPRHKG